MFNPKPSKTTFSEGNKSAGILDDFAVRKSMESDESNINILTITEDNTTLSTGIVRNIILGTDATPPTASGYVTGTLYVQYTA